MASRPGARRHSDAIVQRIVEVATLAYAHVPAYSEVSARRRIRSLRGLFALYTFALLSITVLSDGEDVGCLLVAILAHVIYAAARTIGSWREDTWLDPIRLRLAVSRPRALNCYDARSTYFRLRFATGALGGHGVVLSIVSIFVDSLRVAPTRIGATSKK